jgi:hypothetical protein
MPRSYLPSVNTLQRIDGVSRVKAEFIRESMRKALLGPLASLANINALLGTYGVKYVQRGKGAKSAPFYYCNTGETYDCTVLYFPMEERFRVGSCGAVVEHGNYD